MAEFPLTDNTDTEIQFEQKVVDLAHVFGWSAMGIRPAGGKNGGFRTPIKYDGKGWPDTTFVHRLGYIIFAEFKRERGASEYTADQKKWGHTLTLCAGAINGDVNDFATTDIERIRYRLWQPRHHDQIVTELSFGRVKEWRP